MPEISRKLATRERILDSARRLFNRRGFASVTIGEIMAGAGLTHGGFYRHFRSKEELYAESVTRFANNGPTSGWHRNYVDPQAEGLARARMIVNAYLSHEHLHDADDMCPMIALPSDIARGSTAVKAAYEEILEMMVGVFVATGQGDDRDTRRRALAIASLCVGGMVVARAVDQDDLADEVRRAAQVTVQDLLA